MDWLKLAEIASMFHQKNKPKPPPPEPEMKVGCIGCIVILLIVAAIFGKAIYENIAGSPVLMYALAGIALVIIAVIVRNLYLDGYYRLKHARLNKKTREENTF